MVIFHIAFFVSNSALAQDSKEQLLEKYSQDLGKIEKYLNDIKNLTAQFSQITSSGSIANGSFLLSRPGKMRVQYDDKTPIIIVVNGGVLSYYDVELDEISNLRTNTTPASFLTRKNISFAAKDVDIIDVMKDDNIMKVTLLKKNSKNAGEFSLLFALNPVNFLQMEFANDLDEIVRVNLYDIDLKTTIDSQSFILKTEEFES